jgi:hypothetical protein
MPMQHMLMALFQEQICANQRQRPNREEQKNKDAEDPANKLFDCCGAIRNAEHRPGKLAGAGTPRKVPVHRTKQQRKECHAEQDYKEHFCKTCFVFFLF